MKFFSRGLTALSSQTPALFCVLLMALVAGSRPTYAQAPGPNHAGVVVQYASGKVGSKCVAFAEPHISGYELLRRSGLPLVVQPSSMGVAVCSINGTGCSNSADCFCQCQTLGASCTYWTFFERTAQNQWRLAALGAAATQVKNGEMQAWVWGSGDADKVSLMPPALGFDEVCGVLPSSREGAGMEKPTPTLVSSANAPTSTPAQTREKTAQPATAASTQTPTAMSLATPTPSPSPREEATPTAAPSPESTRALPTEIPSTPKQSDQSDGADRSGYLAFFAICAGLVGVAVLRRRH